MARDVLFTDYELLAATGGRPWPSILPFRALDVVIDSRKAKPGSLFVPLLGENQDGHDYIEAAFASGAAVCLVSEAKLAERGDALRALAEKTGGALVAVADTLAALHRLAAYHVDRFPSLVRIGVTGSSGKTTTKELIASILSREFSTVSNEGNLNSETGLPLSVLAIDEGHRFGVFEMGMNHEGEMDALANILRPSVALITNIGTAHIGILGSREKIAEEKKKIFSHFSNEGTGFVFEDEKFLPYLSSGVRGTVRTFGPRTTPGYTGSQDLGLDGTLIRWEGLQIRFPLPGSYNLLNALGAIAVAGFCGAAPESVAAGLSSAKTLFGRGEIVRGEVTVIRDCYNANPDSMEKALDFCDSVAWKGRKVYVLGSMLELGEHANPAHAAIGEAAAKSTASAVFFFGEEMRAGYEAFSARAGDRKAVFSTDPGEIGAALKAYVKPGDLVLLKASRGMSLEKAADFLNHEREDSSVS
jgi:UDP-N-acetylmuramoyl-tripeptide--D-alanyl-D-alanine ligase